LARELLPARYPFVSEFRQALALDPANHDLRRALGYLLLRMGRESEAEVEFRVITQNAPEDLLSATQLGFLLYARGEKIAATPLFDRVLAGQDDDLANRVRAVLRMPQVLRPRAAAAPQSIDGIAGKDEHGIRRKRGSVQLAQECELRRAGHLVGFVG
jgi:Flp pilus assembly protein TadD